MFTKSMAFWLRFITIKHLYNAPEYKPRLGVQFYQWICMQPRLSMIFFPIDLFFESSKKLQEENILMMLVAGCVGTWTF